MRENKSIYKWNQLKWEIYKWKCGSKSGTNGEWRLPAGEKILRNGMEIR